MRRKYVPIVSLVFLATALSFRGYAQEPVVVGDAIATAGDLWSDFLASRDKVFAGERELFTGDVLRSLWEDYVRPQIENPSADVLTALNRGQPIASPIYEGIAMSRLKGNWVILLERILGFDSRQVNALGVSDVVAETVRACPREIFFLPGMGGRPLSTSPEVIVATVEEMLAFKETNVQILSVFLEDFEARLFANVRLEKDALGATSLLALAVLGREGLADSKEIDKLVTGSARTSRPDPVRFMALRILETSPAEWTGIFEEVAAAESGETLLDKTLGTLEIKAANGGKAGALKAFEKALDGDKGETKVDDPIKKRIDEGIKKAGKNVRK